MREREMRERRRVKQKAESICRWLVGVIRRLEWFDESSNNQPLHNQISPTPTSSTIGATRPTTSWSSYHRHTSKQMDRTRIFGTYVVNSNNQQQTFLPRVWKRHSRAVELGTRQPGPIVRCICKVPQGPTIKRKLDDSILIPLMREGLPQNGLSQNKISKKDTIIKEEEKKIV